VGGGGILFYLFSLLWQHHLWHCVYVAGAVTLYLFLVPAGALILLVTLVSLFQLYQPKLLPGMVQPLGLKKVFCVFY
jgi:hypothetical protein